MGGHGPQDRSSDSVHEVTRIGANALEPRGLISKKTCPKPVLGIFVWREEFKREWCEDASGAAVWARGRSLGDWKQRRAEKSLGLRVSRSTDKPWLSPSIR